MGYVYRGTPDKCGTEYGYELHLKNKTIACTRCLIAHACTSQQWRAKQPGYKIVQPCGTYAGAKRHYKNGEKPCEPCRKAVNTYQAEQKAKKKAERLCTPPAQSGPSPTPAPEC